MAPKKVRKARTLLQAFLDPRVESYSDGRNGWCNDGVWLYLKYPWWCPDTDTSTVHEFTVFDTLASLNNCYEAPERWVQGGTQLEKQ